MDQEIEICDRPHCGEPATATDTKGVGVCQYHAEESWMYD